MDTITLGKGIHYNHTLKGDKHFFAGYLNLAYDNIETVLNNYEKKYGPYEITRLNKLSEPEYEIRIEFLQYQLPVLRTLNLPPTDVRFERERDKLAARRSYLLNSFQRLQKLVTELRNFYTHYHHKPLVIQRDTYELVNDLFLSTILEVRSLKKKNDHTRQFLKESLSEEYAILYKEKEDLLREKKRTNKRIVLSEDSIHSAIFNDAFGRMITKDKETGDITLRKQFLLEYDPEAEAAENGITVSQNGLLFLLSMFLTRREGEELRGKVKHFKAKVISGGEEPVSSRNNSFRFMATHWVYSYLSFKGAKNQLHNTFSRETLLMQIVDELSKVPDELYQCLPEVRRQELIEDINEYYKTGNETETMEASQVIHPVIRKRYESKFNYFVLRYLDEFADFPTLRFQVHVGNYIHDTREKTINGTKYITERKVKEPIHVFGRLTRITDIKEHYFANNPDASAEEGWEMFPSPSYNITNQNIPIYLGFDKNNSDPELVTHVKKLQNGQHPDRTNPDKATKQQIRDKIFTKKEKDIHAGKPIALLSMNELPALLHELLILKKSPEEIENTLRSKIWENYQRISRFSPDNEYHKATISQKLLLSQKEETLDIEKLRRSAENEVQLCKDKLGQLDSNRREQRSGDRPYVFYSKEIGREASWLADDLKQFMPKEFRENWKGYQHSQLQSSLGYFNQNSAEPAALLGTNWDFSASSNLYSKEIYQILTNHRYFDLMYEAYLEFRQRTFTAISKGLKDYRTDKKLLTRFLRQQHIWNLFTERQYKIPGTEKQIKELLSQPFVFARGIFDEKPTFIKGRRVTENPELFADWYQYVYKPHEVQQFYAWERDYDSLFKKALEQKEFLNNKNGLSVAEQDDLVQLKTDMHVKFIKTQDIYLKLIADDIHKDILDQPFAATLSDIYKTRAERLAIQQAALAQHQREEGDTSANILNDSFVWNKAVTCTHDQVVPFEVKIKDLRKRKRFLESEKVKTLFSYDPNRQWTITELEETLMIGPDSYETIRREELLNEIHQLEASILSAYSLAENEHPAELEEERNPNFRRYIATGLLDKHQLAPAEDIAWLQSLNENAIRHCTAVELQTKPDIVQKAFLIVLLRNKFAHNQLLSSEMFDLICHFMNCSNQSDKYTQSARILASYVKQTVGEFQEKIGVAGEI